MTNENLIPTDPRDEELAALRQQVVELRQQLEELPVLRQQVAALEQPATWARALITQFPSGRVFVYDADLRYVEVGGTALLRSGTTREALIGRTIYELFPPEISTTLEGPYRAALAGQTPTFQMPFSDGVYQVSILPVRDDDEQIRAGIVLSIDITERVAAERQLRIFQQLVEQAPYSVAFNSMKSQTIVYANPAMQALFGHRQPLAGMQITALLAASTMREVSVVGPHLQRGEPWSGRYIYQRADGTTFPGVATLFPIHDSTTGPMVGTIIRDVTSEEQAEQERQAQVVAAQVAVIRELATPLIPLGNDVVAMPLVGALDSTRVQQVLEVLLEGIVEHQADYAILDITGVTGVDTYVAQALLRVAQSVKLLGAQLILSGLGAKISLILVELGADLSGIVTVATLQQAIAYALEQRISL